MLNIIKDYLISVGMHVDKQSFKQADKAINDVDKGLGKFASSATGKFVKVGAGAIALASAVGVAMAKFSTSVAEADRQVGLLARRLYTTKENARSLTFAMKQMGISSLEELRELSLDPESREQFLELKTLARSLENPETQKALKEIREINHEWRKLMVRFEYFKIEVAGKILQIFKQLKPTFQKMIDWFKPTYQALLELKDSFVGALPNIIKGLKYVWSILKPILNIIRATVIFVIKGWKLIFDGIKQMPTVFKTAFNVIKFVLDPIIKIFRFIEDLMVYLAGGLSHREKLFDRLSFLRNIREGAGGSTTVKNYTWGETISGFKAGKVNRRGEIDPNGLVLSEANRLALQSLGSAMGNVANKFKITSGFEGGHAIGSAHGKGLAMDFGFAGTSLQDQLALIRATLNDANISKALLEVDAKTKNQIYNQLTAEGADLSKLSWKKTKADNNHLHVEHPTSNVINNNFNISTPDPKQVVQEFNRDLSLLYSKGNINPN